MQQALDISSNTKLFTSYFQNNIIVQKYFHMDGNSIFIAFQWSARGKGKIFEKNNVYMCVCVTFALKVDTCTLIPSYFYDAIQDLVLSCKLYSTTSFCFDAPPASGSVRFLLLLLNDLEDFPQAACDHQSNLFLEQFFFSWNMKMEIDLLQRIFLKIQILRFEEMWNFNGSGKEIRDSGILFFKKFNLLYFELAYLKNIYSQYNY